MSLTMARIVNRGPLQSLKGKVASIEQLREMSRAQMRRNECKICHITYTSADAARRCTRWHRGR